MAPGLHHVDCTAACRAHRNVLPFCRMGMNILDVPSRQGSLRYRENTLRSFQQAATCGATFVEFDVQVRLSAMDVGLERHRGLQA